MCRGTWERRAPAYRCLSGGNNNQPMAHSMWSFTYRERCLWGASREAGTDDSLRFYEFIRPT